MNFRMLPGIAFSNAGSKVKIIGLALSALAIGQAAQAMELDKELLKKRVLRALNEGADINCQNEYGGIAAHVTCSKDYSDIIELLTEHQKFLNEKLLKAMEDKKADEIVRLLKQGADINFEDKDGFTSLLVACSKNCPEIVKLLIGRGADVNLADKNGWTPLYAACCHGYLEIVKKLIEHEADVNLACDDGRTPLYAACICGREIEIVKLLIEHKAAINLADKNGVTPLYRACWDNHSDIVKLFIENQAGINLADKNGWTPLHVVCWEGHSEIVKLLIEHGADINLKKEDGQTALDIANGRGHSGIATRIVHEPERRKLIAEKQVLEKSRLFEHLQRNNANNLDFVLLLSQK